MDNIDHVRRQNRLMPTIVDRLFVESNTEIARKVNQDKDAMSGELPGILHRIYNHGITSNIQYLRRYGARGLKAGMQHDMDDVRHSLGRSGKRKIETIGELIKIRRMRSFHKSEE